MIAPEVIVQIRHLYFAEHWKIGTIASELGLHHDTVRTALETDSFNRIRRERMKPLIDPYLEFIEDTLKAHPRLRATRILQMIRARGYKGSTSYLRRVVHQLRPAGQKEAFLQLRTFPGEQGQADWADFGEVRIGRARRRLSCFVMTLSYSRALSMTFFFDQGLENLLRGHVAAFDEFHGSPRTILYDNMKQVVLRRRGDDIEFHPRLLELAAHYHFAPKPCNPGRGNEKGRVERAIQYIRTSFFAARPFTTLEDVNRQARQWRDQIAHQRPWPEDDSRIVGDVFAEEQPQLLPLPAHPFDTDRLLSARTEKTIYLRFDLNDYSIPPDAIGRELTLAISPTTIRVLDGLHQIAVHRRSWDRHQIIEDPAHRQALLEEKRRALGASPSGRLVLAVPESEKLLNEGFRRGESIGRSTTRCSNFLTITARTPCERRFNSHSSATRRVFPQFNGCFSNADAPNKTGKYVRSNSAGGPIWLISTFNRMLAISMTISLMTMKPDLASELLQLGLITTAQSLDDFIARATKGRWSPQVLLEEMARSEFQGRSRRSLERRLKRAKLGRFKPLADFDWNWPKKIDRSIIERALTLDFIPEARNLILLGTNGLGKTMIAKNIAYAALQAGYTVLFRTAPEILADLHCESPQLLRRKLNSYARSHLLAIDEVGYLSYDSAAADLLYEVINRRYERRSLLITANKAFKEWNTVFPNATSIATLLDRLTHHADITLIEGQSYRVRESELEIAARRKKA